MKMQTVQPIALTIAGLDPSGWRGPHCRRQDLCSFWCASGGGNHFAYFSEF